MQTLTCPRFRPGFSVLFVLACSLIPVALFAQAASGVIVGRVLNAASKEYVRNAEVRVEGTGLAAYTEEGGYYRLVGVPVGANKLTATYAGTESATSTVTVQPNQAATVDFELGATGVPADHAVIRMGEFTVSTEREGQAKAIMDQRAAINAKAIVATDNFGELTMGDVGEFLKYMPGLTLDYLEVDTSAVRIGGLDPKYASFTQDSIRLASSDPAFGSGARRNTFEQMSITGNDVVEFNNTLTASMEADSPGGNINLRSRSAFDRKNRLIVFQAAVNGTTDAMSIGQSYMPDEKKHRKMFPAAQIGYSDVFLDRRLGLQLSASYNASFVQQDRNQVEYNYTNQDRPVITGIMWRPGPKITRRTAANVSLDFKATPELTFAWRSAFSLYEVEFFNQYTWLRASTAQITPESSLTHVVASATTNANTRLGTEYSHRANYQPNYVLAPRLEWKHDTWTLTARGGYSSSKTSNRDMANGFFRNTNDRITRLSWQADRPTPESPTWTITELSGPDWSNPANWGSRDTHANNIVSNADETGAQMFSGYLDVKKALKIFGQTAEFKTGIGSRLNTYSYAGSTQQWTFVGATGNQLQAVVPATQNYRFALDLGGKAGNINSLGWRADDTYGTYNLYQQHPEWFVPDTLGNFSRALTSPRTIQEEVDSAYVEGNARWGKFRFNLGLRGEETKTKGLVWDPRTRAELVAAGYPVNASGAPTTAAGVLYQYHNGERAARYGKYDNLFLSGGVKYFFTRQLVGQLAMSDAILHPDYGNLAGITTVNDTSQTVTVPNPNLKPETSTKYFAALQYYFEPASTLSISAFRLNVKNQLTARTQITPEQAGYGPDEYPGYTFFGYVNGAGKRRTDGVTIEYDQKLTFLPAAFRGLSIFGSVTRAIADEQEIGVIPKAANGGIRYRYRRFNLQLRSTWQSAKLISVSAPTNGSVWGAERTLVDVSGGYKLTDHFDLMFSIRNIANAPYRQYSNEPGRTQLYDVYGTLWNVGIKGTF
jgi:TonB-dependent receptor